MSSPPCPLFPHNLSPERELTAASRILLISPSNQVLLLHRVKTSSSFASAHVFPGGNLDANQEGPIPEPSSPARHIDSENYRLGAVRECFEESGILLAKDRDGKMLAISDAEKEEARARIHANTLNFKTWVESKGGVVDTHALLPFTRWITPVGVPRRFTTQMYVYFWPLNGAGNSLLKEKDETALVATSDGGKEHTEAVFRDCATWCNMAQKGEVILFPPQFYLIWQLGKYLQSSAGSLEEQRDKAKELLKGSGTNGIPWADKCISPQTLGMWNGRAVLDLSKPGPELKDSGRAGEPNEVVLVKFSKEGPREVDVRERKVVLDVMRAEKAAKESKI